MTSRAPSPLRSLAELQTSEFDVVVAGAGAAGLSAALFASIRGATVVVVEKTELVGGTSSYTAGTLWIPGTDLAVESGGPEGDLDVAARFLDGAVGDRSDPALRRAFLDAGNETVETLRAEPDMELIAREYHPDYMAEVEGASLGWRALEARTLDGTKLPTLGAVRQQTQEFTVFGGMMLAREDIAAFSEVARGWWIPRNWGHVVTAALTFARHCLTRPFSPRATRMTMGNALVGRLMLALQRRGVPILLSSTISEIVREGDAVQSVVVEQGGVTRSFTVARALIAATGGFNRHPQRRAQMMPGVEMEWSPIAPGSTGQLHDLIEGLGGHYAEMPESSGFWAPVSLPPRPDGTLGVYPHFALDRGKPGFVVVDQGGDRYLNESTSYHRFGLAMQQRPEGRGMPSFLVGDARAVTRYGIGAVRPGGWGTRARLRDGYLLCAPTLDGLAAKMGADAARLQASVAAINEYAKTGIDPDFARGTTVYERNNGDATHGPNPSIGEISQGPFYAIRLYPGDIGAATGFVTDAEARVLDADASAIGKLYAIGNDMQSVMGDRYPAPGITLGPAVVFAFIAVRDALRVTG